MSTVPQEPIFPVAEPDGRGYAIPTEENPPTGLTKREYFAAQALQGLLAADGLKSLTRGRFLAQVAVDNADALIDELNVEDRLNG
jgi:hypothetical protein